MGGFIESSSLATRTDKQHWGTATGILLIVAGLFAFFLPLIAGIAITAVLGWILLFAALARLAYTWSTRSHGGVVWQTIVGLLYLAVAFYLILHPARALLTLTLLLAIYFVVEGIFELITYAGLRKLHRAGWFLWDGLITLLLGVLIWAQWPVSSVWAIGVLVGVSLVSSGVARLTFRHGGPAPLLGAA